VVEMTNAGVSGDTSAGGLARLDWALAEHPDVVLVELGANDALRGIDPKQTYANLDKILARVKASGAKVLLLGMLAPPNWGHDYEKEFDAIYPALARKYDVPLYPFFLDGVATLPDLNQEDGIHPNKQGVEIIVGRVAPYVQRLLGGKGAQG
jgi:acyl-CoA thioesterase-1